MSDSSKSLFTGVFPTLVGGPGEVPKEEATIAQTRGPWTLEDSQPGRDDSWEEVAESDLPAVPDAAAATAPRLNSTPLPVPMPAQATEPAAKAAPARKPERQASAPASSDPEPSIIIDAWEPSADPVGSTGKLIGGRYAVEARIGEGGMGRVYRVKHRELGKTFALKIMRSFLAADENARKAFFREARLASSLSHPAIVSIVDFGEDPALGAYMAMELLDGEPLKNILKKGRMPLRQACDIMLQIADAIRYVHDKGVVHCDLKTENVLVSSERTETGRRKPSVKLLDFGLARLHENAGQSMALSGTPAYLAPERIRGAAPAPSMDIYSLGIVFYEMVTGAPPFTGPIESVLFKHINDPPPPPSVTAGDLDERVEALIMKSLAKRPGDRQKNVGAFIYELRTAMEMLGYGTRRRSRSKTAEQRGSDFVGGLFADCPLPLAVFNADATILVGNKAFSKFVAGGAIDLRGVDLKQTAMVRAAPGMVDEIRSVASTGRPGRVSMTTRASGGGTLELIAWLTPSADGEQVYCAIHIVSA